MKRQLVAGALALTSILGLAGAASAQPPGLEKKGAEEYLCTTGTEAGRTLVVFSAGGRSAWIDGRLYLATSLSFVGPMGQYHKTYGQGPKRGGPEITCAGTVEYQGETYRFSVAAVPVPGHRGR